ncbi:MAG: hypothetical protein ACD_10C00326G0001, partial [uncultured bacterium]
MHFLDDQFRQVVKDVFKLIRLAAHVGRHVVQTRLFAEVETDHFRHIGVDRFVVSHTGANGIGQGHITGLISLEDARHAEGRIGAKNQRIHKVIVNPAIDHINFLRPLRRLHIDHFVLDEKVATFDQFNAHLLREEGMFKIGAVVSARRQHHDGRIIHPGRGYRPQFFQQHVGVVLNRRHFVFGEKLREEPHHHLAVFKHVGNTRRHAQIVFQHIKLAGAGTDNIDPGNMRIDTARHVNTLHDWTVLRIVQYLLGWYFPRPENLLVMVNIMQEHVQRPDPLPQTALHRLPFGRRNNARNNVKRNEPLFARLFAVNCKGNANPVKSQIGLRPLARNALRRG